jgi:hypothetical protein
MDMNYNFKLEPDESVLFETKKKMLAPADFVGVAVLFVFGLFFPPALIGAIAWIPMRFYMDNSFRLWLTNKRIIVWEKGTKSIATTFNLSDIVTFHKGVKEVDKVNKMVDVYDFNIYFNGRGTKIFEGLQSADEFTRLLATQIGFKSTDGYNWYGQ